LPRSYLKRRIETFTLKAKHKLCNLQTQIELKTAKKDIARIKTAITANASK